MRKLATAAAAYSAAVFTAVYAIPREWLPYCALAAALFSASAVFLKGKKRLLSLLVTIPLACGLIWSWGYYRMFIEPAEALAGRTVTVESQVLDYPVSGEGYQSVHVRLRGGDVPNVKAKLYSLEADLSGLRPGDIVRATVYFTSAATRYNETTDAYTSQGIFARGYISGAPENVGRSGLSFLMLPKTAARYIGDIVKECFPADVAPLENALLTGGRTELSKDYRLNSAMGTSGLAHIVSISGMHVSFLVGVVRNVTGRRRRTAFICIPLIILFISMAGAGSAVIRAGFMQIALLLAPLLKRENDSLTSMAAVLAALLMANPQSAASCALQLSFAAMAGILLITPRLYISLYSLLDGRGLLHNKYLRGGSLFIVNVFSSTVGAIAFTTPLVALHFGYVSLVAALTNILCLLPMSAAFICGYIASILGMLWLPLGTAAAALIALPVRWTIWVVETAARLPFAAIYTDGNLAAVWLALTYAVFVVSYMFRGKSFRPILPLCISVSTLCAVIVITGAYYRSAVTAAVLDIGQGQCIAVLSENAAAVIDCGGTGKEKNAGEAAADYILSRGRTRVDVLALTHLHADHANGVARLLARMDVGVLLLPSGADDADGLLNGILDAAAGSGAEVRYLADTSAVRLGTLDITAYPSPPSGSTNEDGLSFLITHGAFDMLVTGDAGAQTEKWLVSAHTLPDTEVLVAGHHGSRYSTSGELLEALTPETAVISVGFNNYGHPSSEVLAGLSERGINIYRTDLNGDVTVRMG